jgi:hypothetical protein
MTLRGDSGHREAVKSANYVTFLWPQMSAIVAANLRENGDLVVIAISSAWASRLRYETDALLAAARKSGVSAQSCRIRVAQG